MRRRIAFIIILFVVATTVAAIIRNRQRFYLPPPEIAQRLRIGMTVPEVESALGMSAGTLELGSRDPSGDASAYVLRPGLGSMIFAQDELSLIFDKRDRLTGAYYQKVQFADEVDEYSLELGTGRKF